MFTSINPLTLVWVEVIALDTQLSMQNPSLRAHAHGHITAQFSIDLHMVPIEVHGGPHRTSVCLRFHMEENRGFVEFRLRNKIVACSIILYMDDDLRER